MQLKYLGQTDIKVSDIGLGALHFGVYLNQNETTNLIEFGYDNGINFIDTSPIYGQGNSEKFMTSFKFSGNGASNTNFITAQIEKNKKLGNPSSIFSLDEDTFNLKMSLLKKEYDSILFSYSDLDSALVDMVTNQNKQMFAYFKNNYSSNKKIAKGKPSPKFENYIDIKGGKKSLDSFKGKYVYIDVWATWCGPCIREIPALDNLEKEFHTKNIAFVSISTDESRRSGGSWEAAKKKWSNFVKDRNMRGIQLWSGKDTRFQQEYQINGIPRFILIDPQGNIVDANAPRPSDPRLRNIFNSLDI